MRKCILVILILVGVATARDPVDAERAALRKKLTRLAEARKSSAASQRQPALAITPAIDKPASKDLLPMAAGRKVSSEPVAQQRAADKIAAVEKSPTPVAQPAAGPAKAAPAVPVGTDLAPAHEVINSSMTGDVQEANGKQEVSLGEIARRYRARKQQQGSSSP